MSAGRGALGPVVLRSAGAHAGLIVTPREPALIRMEGHETFLVAVASLCEATLDVCREADADLADVDLFVYHQANRRILDAVAERLALPRERLVDAIGELGNTSAASIPLALSLAADEGLLAPGSRVLVGAMGSGFTYGAALLNWEAEEPLRGSFSANASRSRAETAP